MAQCLQSLACEVICAQINQLNRINALLEQLIVRISRAEGAVAIVVNGCAHPFPPELGAVMRCPKKER